MHGKKGTKSKRHGRHPGGICLYVKSNLSVFCERIYHEFPFGIFIKISEEIMNRPTIFGAIYLPPEGSSQYQSHETNGVIILEDMMYKIKAEYPDHDFILSGDFNARTQTLKDYIIDDDVKYIPGTDDYVSDNFDLPRQSKDTHAEANSHGKALLSLCCTMDIHIVNGRIGDDVNGEFTCFANNGRSIVDYTIISSTLFQYIKNFKIESCDDYTHLPQCLEYVVWNSIIEPSRDKVTNEAPLDKRLKFQWSEKSSLFLASTAAQDLISSFHELIMKQDVNGASSKLVQLLQETGTKKNQNSHKMHQNDGNAPWWDGELELLKQKKYKLLRLFRLENTEDSFNEYKFTRNKFKNLCRKKQTMYKSTLRERIEGCSSPSDFWKIVKSLKHHKNCVNSIDANAWNEYFKALLNSNNCIDKDHSQNVLEYLSWHDYNCEQCKDNNDILNEYIKLEEVESVIKDLPTKKAPGIDGIVNEIIRNSKAILVPLLCSLFNIVLTNGIFPDEWCDAIIVPIHKKGDVNNPGNYRGIALLSNIGKIFTKIVNKRLVMWALENSKLYEEQAGFTKGKSTVDHLFVLQALVQKYLTKSKGRFYSVYVDFSKAFDTVPHKHLFYRLITEGIHGNILKVLQNMYSKLRACVQSGNSLTVLFHCLVGTRQGCMLSPFLFIFYLNELIKMSNANECEGIYINEYHRNITMLLYADDLIILGDQVGRVQKLLNVLSNFCSLWGLQVNLGKTKVMVYRNGGIISKNEKFYFNGKEIENVSYYKYLGIMMSTRLSWSPAQTTLASQAQKAAGSIHQINYKCNGSFKTSVILFDKCIAPILTYGSEIWGLYVHKSIENVQIRFCKKLLHVGSKTPTKAVLGECGRFPMYIICFVKCLKYWFKILTLPNECLIRSCYNMLCKFDEAGKHTWVTKVKHILLSYGFGHVWYNQGVENVNVFLKEFKQRLLDCEIQDWAGCKSQMPKLYYYNMYKTLYMPELYLYMNISTKLKASFAKFRMSNHNLEIEIGRQTKVDYEDRLCKACGKLNLISVECEYHVIMKCHLYHEIRRKYLSQFLNTGSLEDFINLMGSNNPETLLSLIIYINKMFTIRNTFMSTV